MHEYKGCEYISKQEVSCGNAQIKMEKQEPNQTIFINDDKEEKYENASSIY